MLRGVVLVAAVLALSVATAHAQSLVKGRVVDAQNKPVEGAVIHFEQKDANYKRDTKSDKKGEFLFVGLPSGEYKVTATKDTLTDTQSARVSGAEQAFVSFQLRAPAPAAAAANPTAGFSAISSATKDSSDAEALKTLAASALESYNANKYAEAIPKFNDLVKKLPTCSDCYMYLSVSYFATNEPEAAETALKKSLEIKPTAEAYNMLANLYNQQKKFELGAAAAKKATELSEAAAAAAPGAAAPAAGATAAPAAAAAPPPPSPEMNSANAYNDGVKLWNDNKYADAKAKFEEAAKANPQNPDAQYMIGMANLNLNQIPAARAAFQSYLKIAPEGDKAAQVKTFLTQLPK